MLITWPELKGLIIDQQGYLSSVALSHDRFSFLV